ncbi:bifunctional DNA-formamidopyrimidine glycosylase/DNA-(apurinic or apyrimidinic site) lyase [Citricoccus sp. I39-566]|uniref:bifunctional DNA-formamidopyrimidine glycosylase/DNA-(apurinic or apyrimidinic site) lyase n=1 Tax=Citricoccus sp. I39-566 TaxID=3073268 RepID=UPI00286D00E9|nr:bifunctional DNA-formamidopyrimidine glycosylase/DNA-(apurinic or apyrimidinic site) lyase [Citricoccus sp. I39-566]WMY77065.1 bifunctional DNA-formamidopyrimidine glycosylase/DNA-(apurinic or apyrimidinic site) lyase [Citricoccus sp. I39-566]
MPELPEVEVVRRGLERWAAGRPVSGVEVLDARSTRRHDGGAAAFEAQLTGRRLAAPERRGKYLWVPLVDPGDTALVAHLGMSGQLLVSGPSDPSQRHLRIRVLLEDLKTWDAPALELRFVDQRLFGGLFLDPLVPSVDRPEQLLPASVAHIARDPLDPHFDADAVHGRLRSRKTGLKRALLDQTLVSGIGNIYADEALWRARLHYARPTETLNRGESARLLAAVQDVMEDALVQGGTSFDALYVNVNGESGYFDRSLNVYGQAGRPCPRCAAQGRDTVIVKDRFMNRSSAYCPQCQPVPRRARW